VTKPEAAGNLAAARDRIREQLVPKIKALCPRAYALTARATVPIAKLPSTGQIPTIRSTGAIPTLRAPAPSPTPRSTGAIPKLRSTSRIATRDLPFNSAREAVTAIAIGVSTGGPPALERVLGALPAELAVPVFIVQHMPPAFTTALAARLDRICPLPVAELVATTLVRPGHVYLARGDFHMVVERTALGVVLRNHQEAPENSCRPAVDVLFRSVAASYGAGTLAIVLTGMGTDGQRGSEHVRAAGGSVLAQDQATSVVWGMPGAVARAGLANAVLPLGEIAPEIVQRVQRAPLLRTAAQGDR
jgi:two-component system chemotaxis response regulator CheB